MSAALTAIPQRRIVLGWALAIISTIFGSILCIALALAVIREFRPSALSDD